MTTLLLSRGRRGHILRAYKYALAHKRINEPTHRRTRARARAHTHTHARTHMYNRKCLNFMSNLFSAKLFGLSQSVRSTLLTFRVHLSISSSSKSSRLSPTRSYALMTFSEGNPLEMSSWTELGYWSANLTSGEAFPDANRCGEVSFILLLLLRFLLGTGLEFPLLLLLLLLVLPLLRLLLKWDPLKLVLSVTSHHPSAVGFPLTPLKLSLKMALSIYTQRASKRASEQASKRANENLCQREAE